MHFKYAPGTREEDKVSRDFLRVHFAVGNLIHLMGGAEALGLAEDQDDDEVPVPSSAPATQEEQQRWTSILISRLQSVMV